MKTKFTQKAEDQETKELEFDRDTITLGRHSTSDIHVVDKKASRHHAKIEIVDGEVRVTDLGSNNGTKVNGENIVTHLLTEGDEISIGATTIKVNQLDLPVAAGKSENEPASMDRQKELKRKIDGVKSAIVADREKTVRERKSSPMIPVVAGVVVVGLIVGVILARSSISGSETARKNTAAAEAQIKLKEVNRDLSRGTVNADKVRNYANKYGRHLEGKNQFTDILDKIELAEQRLNEVKLAEFNQDLDIEEVQEYATKLGRYLPRNKNGKDPFTAIALKHGKNNPNRIPEAQFKTLLAKMKENVEIAIRQKEYAKAIEEIETLVANANPEQKRMILPSFYKAKETIWKDFQSIIQEGSQLESEERYEEAKNLYAGQAPQFEGTEFHAILSSRPDDLDLLVRARATERKIREATEKKEKEAAL
ncbi:MAG: FHA domain-containing protein, partial [Planctomycetota bacterium]|nr:FHA domain-containing protein [Planctomycetota bacterium]